MPIRRRFQPALIPGTWAKQRFAFGGALLKNSHAKVKRPFHRKLPLHVVLRSGKARLLAYHQKIQRILRDQAARSHVKVICAANAGNHLHLLIEAPSREHLAAFLRGISGRIAMMVSGKRKGQAGEKSFWDARPFTRILSRGRDQNTVTRYMALNSTELAGFSRENARGMFRKIAELLARGCLPRGPTLVATGFA